MQPWCSIDGVHHAIQDAAPTSSADRVVQHEQDLALVRGKPEIPPTLEVPTLPAELPAEPAAELSSALAASPGGGITQSMADLQVQSPMMKGNGVPLESPAAAPVEPPSGSQAVASEDQRAAATVEKEVAAPVPVEGEAAMPIPTEAETAQAATPVVPAAQTMASPVVESQVATPVVPVAQTMALPPVESQVATPVVPAAHTMASPPVESQVAAVVPAAQTMASPPVESQVATPVVPAAQTMESQVATPVVPATQRVESQVASLASQTVASSPAESQVATPVAPASESQLPLPGGFPGEMVESQAATPLVGSEHGPQVEPKVASPQKSAKRPNVKQHVFDAVPEPVTAASATPAAPPCQTSSLALTPVDSAPSQSVPSPNGLGQGSGSPNVSISNDLRNLVRNSGGFGQMVAASAPAAIGGTAAPAPLDQAVNTSSHRKEAMRLNRFMESPDAQRFPHMLRLFQGSRDEPCECFKSHHF